LNIPRFLANENFPLKSVYRLREASYDVVAIIESSPGAKDRELLACAARDYRIVLTFDRDYGTLIFRDKLAVPAGVLYFCFIPKTPEEPAEHLSKLLSMKDLRLEGKFTVVERVRVRQRPLP
jgi:predicted nuclease of predicted toxin-antitoxin system